MNTDLDFTFTNQTQNTQPQKIMRSTKTKRTIRLLACAIPAFFAINFSLSAQPVLDDTFADSERDTQNLPNSSAWYVSSGTSNLAVVNNELTFTAAGNGRTILTYFGTDAAGANGVSLGVGDSIRVNFDFSVSGTVNDASQSLRIGFLNSATSTATTQRVSGDNFGNSNAAFVGYTGYGVFVNPGGSGTSPLRFFERTNLTDDALLTTSGNWTELERTLGVADQLATGTDYTAELIATRTGTDELDLAFSIIGGSLGAGDYTVTHTVTSGITSTFDTLAMATTSSQALDYSFDSFTVVPEPSGFGFAVLAATLGFVCYRRRRV